MSIAPPDEAVMKRVTEVLAGLDATYASDATIGRAEPPGGFDTAELPVLSMDEGVLARSSAAREPKVGRRPDLQLVSLLGEGGMGAVYSARQRALNRDVAVKRIRAGDVSEHTRTSLLTEARVMGALEHPNIVPVHALGVDDDGLPVLVMKRVEGVSWRVLLENADHPMWSELGGQNERGLPFHVRVLVSVCNALRFAHGRGVIHRDVKPDNVMIGAFGEVYLLDWGVARSLDTESDGRVVGTPAYMAPEMVVDPASADERTDVYLLGAVLHEILTGHVLHRGSTLAQVLCAAMLAKPRGRADYAESVPAILVDLCVAATHPDRSVRIASVETFRASLAAYDTHRASKEIAASALSKLDDAEQRAATVDRGLGDVDVGVLLAASRFGLEQSLQQWPDNDVARRGLQRCLERSCERELVLRNADVARALLATLPEDRPELVARVDELERELERTRNAVHEHARQTRDMDATVSAVPRLAFLAALMLVGTGMSTAAYLEEQRTGEMMSIAEQLQLDLSVLGFLTVGLLFARRRLLTNAFNRASWALWYIGCTAVTVSDAYLGHIGVDSREATPIGFGLIALVFTLGALTVSRPIGFVALTLWATALLSGVFPTAATLIATIGLFLSICVSMEITRRIARRAAEPRSAR